jgi:acyl-coenzyme A thioesterase 13
MTNSDPPDGFKPLFRTSPFLEHNGPFFYRENDDGTFVVGLRIQPKHANARGIAHVDVHKVGGRLAFANCYLKVGDERIVHASAVFARTGDRAS